jgi:uroporphyrinogen III methyltransferase / synthase
MVDTAATASEGPLAGRSVIVTRTSAQAAALAEPLKGLGAEVIAVPVIEIVDPEDWSSVDIAVAHLSDYDWVILTSTNGADRFLARVREHGLEPAERLASAGVRVAAVGSATAERLTAAGVRVDTVPPKGDFRAEGLVDAFRNLGAGRDGCHWRMLVPRALEAREVLP